MEFPRKNLGNLLWLPSFTGVYQWWMESACQDAETTSSLAATHVPPSQYLGGTLTALRFELNGFG